MTMLGRHACRNEGMVPRQRSASDSQSWKLPPLPEAECCTAPVTRSRTSSLSSLANSQAGGSGDGSSFRNTADGEVPAPPAPQRSVRFAPQVEVHVVPDDWLACLERDTDTKSSCECCPQGQHYSGMLRELVKALYMGIEVTFRKDTWLPTRRRHGILFSEDGGHTLSWLETGTNAAIKVWQVPCRFLLEFAEAPTKHKGGAHAVRLRYRAASTGPQEKMVIFEDPKVGDFERFSLGMAALVRLNTAFPFS